MWDLALCARLLAAGLRTFCTDAYDFDHPNADCVGFGPRAVVRPRGAADVALALALAANASAPGSVRGGGHGFTCTAFRAGSVHLDMRSLRARRVVRRDHGAGGAWVAEFGAGNRFVDLADVIDPARFSYVHGECDEVGVGGYYLHGGIHAGALTRRLGWGNASLVEMEVVLADGRVLLLGPNATEHAALWRAMRLAGSSFGVATRLAVRLHEEPEPTSFMLYTSSHDVEVALALARPHPEYATDVAYNSAGIFAQVTALGGRSRWAVLWGLLTNGTVPWHTVRGAHPLPRGSLYNFRGRLMTANTYSFARPSWRAQAERTFAAMRRLDLASHGNPWLWTARATRAARAVLGALDPYAVAGEVADCHCVLWPCPGAEADCLAMEIDCWPDGAAAARAARAELAALEAFYERFPGRRKYANTPTPGVADPAVYWSADDYDALLAAKRAYDPDDVFRVPGGIPLVDPA
jgi:hypothetical protein